MDPVPLIKTCFVWLDSQNNALSTSGYILVVMPRKSFLTLTVSQSAFSIGDESLGNSGLLKIDFVETLTFGNSSKITF